MHWCANLVCEAEGTASAVLLRALEPVEGIAIMRRRRGRVDDRELCSGPGKLCQALGITRDLDGKMMSASEVLVHAPTVELPVAVAVTPRIGITKAADWPLRFLVEGIRTCRDGAFGAHGGPGRGCSLVVERENETGSVISRCPFRCFVPVMSLLSSRRS